MFLASANLSSIPAISHGFFTRNGGVSSGIYDSLNCGGRGVGDTVDNVDENRKRVALSLGTTMDKLVSLYQIHSADVLAVDMPWPVDGRPQADAMVTRKPGIALGILTADCVPVLFADRSNGVIGAAHAGWKGAFSGVIEQTVAAMVALGAKRESIVAAVGPAIAQYSYEVGREFYETFLHKSAGNSRYFIASPNAGCYLFDLKGFVTDNLVNSGISDINMLENDTYLEEDTFFSYRRATHRAEADYGRQISAIMMRDI